MLNCVKMVWDCCYENDYKHVVVVVVVVVVIIIIIITGT
jgi:hypothetical protein